LSNRLDNVYRLLHSFLSNPKSERVTISLPLLGLPMLGSLIPGAISSVVLRLINGYAIYKTGPQRSHNRRPNPSAQLIGNPRWYSMPGSVTVINVMPAIMPIRFRSCLVMFAPYTILVKIEYENIHFQILSAFLGSLACYCIFYRTFKINRLWAFLLALGAW